VFEKVGQQPLTIHAEIAMIHKKSTIFKVAIGAPAEVRLIFRTCRNDEL
jgi:hypothetical protein